MGRGVHPVAKRGPSDEEGAEQLGGHHMAEVRLVAMRALNSQKGVK